MSEDIQGTESTRVIQHQQQEAWAIQQVEAVYVNGFAVQANLDGTSRLAFNEKCRADIPGSVRAALLLPGEVIDKLIDTLTGIRAQQKEAMAPSPGVPTKEFAPVIDDHAAGAVGG